MACRGRDTCRERTSSPAEPDPAPSSGSSDHFRSTPRDARGSRARWAHPATRAALGRFQAPHHNFFSELPSLQSNQEGWKKLTGTLEQRGVRVLWVSRDTVETTRDYCMTHGISLSDTLADPPYRTYVQLGLARVPNTMLVSANGTVEKVWAGSLDQSGWKAIYGSFREPEQMVSPTRLEVGARTTECGSEPSQTSVKSCR